MKKMELVSFKLCPFVQRAVITLKYKKVDFDITYIDLKAPPAWFKEISPLGQVPLLKVGDEVLFESSVIQEYVDEVTPPSLHPKDPLIKAKNRAWIAFGGDLFMLSHQLIHAPDEEAYAQKLASLTERLARIEAAHSGEAYFNGNDFNLIDAAYAPLLMRVDLILQNTGVDLLSACPKLKQWSDNLLKIKAIEDSVVEAFAELYLAMLKGSNGHLMTLLK